MPTSALALGTNIHGGGTRAEVDQFLVSITENSWRTIPASPAPTEPSWEHDESPLRLFDMLETVPRDLPNFYALYILLRHKDSLAEYFSNFISYHSLRRFRRKEAFEVDRLLRDGCGFGAIDVSFLWEETLEGEDHWERISLSFYELTQELKNKGALQ